jgi:polyisoprenoid-binding protein YceI
MGWTVDTSHSGISFSVRHLMIAKVRGSFAKWSATVDFDEANPAQSKIEAHIDAASLDTKEEKRDAHLRSADFFDVATFPELVFKSREITRDDGDYVVAGDLTIHGVTRQHARRLRGQDVDQPEGVRPELEPGARSRRRSRR